MALLGFFFVFNLGIEQAAYVGVRMTWGRTTDKEWSEFSVISVPICLSFLHSAFFEETGCDKMKTLLFRRFHSVNAHLPSYLVWLLTSNLQELELHGSCTAHMRTQTCFWQLASHDFYRSGDQVSVVDEKLQFLTNNGSLGCDESSIKNYSRFPPKRLCINLFCVSIKLRNNLPGCQTRFIFFLPFLKTDHMNNQPFFASKW